MVKFPEELDGDEELYKPADEVDDIIAAHHNALAAAIKAIEEKIGIDGSAIVNSFDFLMRNAVIMSAPPAGKRRVYRIWRNEQGLLEYEYETEAES